MTSLAELKAAYARLDTPGISDGGIYRYCCHTRLSFSHGAFCAMPYLAQAIELIESMEAEEDEGWEGLDGDTSE